MRRRAQGFTLLEVVLAIAIVGVALIALAATVTEGIDSAASSINQRAAREACRAKLEAIVAGTETSDSGGIEGREGFTYSATREEKTTGASDTPDEKYIVLTVRVSYPTDSRAPQDAAAAYNPTAQKSEVALTTLIDPPEIIEKKRNKKK